MFGDLKASAAGVVCLALGLLAGGVTVRTYDAWFIIPAAERAAADAATTATDAKWQKLLTDARDLAETIRRKAERDIAAAERDYLDRDAARAAQMTALEQALEQDQANVPTPSVADRGASSVCGPAIRRGVRDALQSLGRTGPRADPAKPDPAVPRGR